MSKYDNVSSGSEDEREDSRQSLPTPRSPAHPPPSRDHHPRRSGVGGSPGKILSRLGFDPAQWSETEPDEEEEEDEQQQREEEQRLKKRKKAASPTPATTASSNKKRKTSKKKKERRRKSAEEVLATEQLSLRLRNKLYPEVFKLMSADNNGGLFKVLDNGQADCRVTKVERFFGVFDRVLKSCLEKGSLLKVVIDREGAEEEEEEEEV